MKIGILITMRHVCVLFCLLLLQNLTAQDKETYDMLFNQVIKLPLGEVLKRGDSYLQSQHTDKAIVLYSIIYGRYQENMSNAEKKICANACLKTGNLYYRQENYAEALEMYVNGLKISESCADKPELMQFYNNIANVYCVFKDYEQGIGYYEMGYSFRNNYPDRKAEMDLLSNLTGYCTFIGRIDKAKHYYKKSEELRLPGDTVKRYMSFYNWGVILESEGKHADACFYFLKAATSIQSPKYKCYAYEKLYLTYQKCNQQDSTLYYFRLCNKLAKKNGLLHMYAQTLIDYADYCEGKDDGKSYYYKSRYLSITDSIYNIREFYRIKNMQRIYEMEKHTRELNDLQVIQKMKEERIRRQLLILSGILGGLLLVLGLLVVVYRQKKKIQDSYRNLFRTNRDLMASDARGRELCRRYEQKIETLQANLEQYEKQQVSDIPFLPDPDEPDVKEGRYQSSLLNREQKQALLKSIREVMEETSAFCEKDFSLEKLAKLVHSNHKYVSQVINEMYQKNFSDFINEYRIHKACIRLIDTEHYGNYTIQVIAEGVGYKSQTTFIRAFRKIVGIPPSIYQKMAREEHSSFPNS